jgi:hypothetical protein
VGWSVGLLGRAKEIEVKKKGLDARNVVIGFILAALALCGTAAWLTGNVIVLLPGLALLPGLGYIVSTRKSWADRL